MQRREIIAATAIAVLMTAPVLYGLLNPSLPVWGLFRRFERFDYSLVDADGKSLRIGDFVQRRAYVTCDHRLVYLIGSWLVESGRARAPLWGRLNVWTGSHSPESIEFTIQLAENRAVVTPSDGKSRP
jgi:hypothetical protein